MSDKLKTLEPHFRQDVEKLLAACRKLSVTMVPYFTLRTPFEQARLWRQSRPRPIIDAKIAELRAMGAPYLSGVLEVGRPTKRPACHQRPPGRKLASVGRSRRLLLASERRCRMVHDQEDQRQERLPRVRARRQGYGTQCRRLLDEH